MESKQIANGILRAIAVTLGVGLLLMFLYAIRSVLLHILIGAAISLMGRPLILFMTQKFKFKNNLAVVITLIFFILILVGIITLFVPLLLEQVYAIAKIDVNKIKDHLQRIALEFSVYFDLESVSLTEILTTTEVTKFLSFSWIPSFLNSVFGSLGNFLISLFSVLFITFFALKDSNLLEKSLLVFAKHEDENKFMNAFNKIKALLSRYFLGLLIPVSYTHLPSPRDA